VRAARSGRRIEATDSVELRPLLLKALHRAEDPVLAGMRKRYQEDLDIESHFVRGGELFVGLKNPQPRPGVGLVLKLGRVDRLFREQEIESVEIWQTIDFRGRFIAGFQRISDLVPMGGQILVSSTDKTGGGALWFLNPGEGSLREIQRFSRYRPEGVAIMPFAPGGIAVFDQKNDPALFLKFDPGR
jgi:hypothetical protein